MYGLWAVTGKPQAHPCILMALASCQLICRATGSYTADTILYSCHCICGEIIISLSLYASIGERYIVWCINLQAQVNHLVTGQFCYSHLARVLFHSGVFKTSYLSYIENVWNCIVYGER